MTSATDKLRRLLDERGVEWFGSYDSDETSWNVGELTWVYGDDGNIAGLGVVQGDITPEQAIAATLGRGTCRNIHEPPNDVAFWPAPHFKCSECGATHVSMEYVFYCPNCGREVVDA